jgi:hypothetical protein
MTVDRWSRLFFQPLFFQQFVFLPFVFFLGREIFSSELDF